MLLSRLNRRYVQAHAQEIPLPFRLMLSPEVYQKSVSYTLAKNKLAEWQDGWDTLFLLGILYSGLLPWLYGQTLSHSGSSTAAQALFLLGLGLFFTLGDLPWDWYTQFRLEERFGFNTSTPKLWWTDLGKEFLLAIGIGYPMLLLLLAVIQWTGSYWWLWAWCCVALIQIVFMVLVPVLIMPWFYKFTPLPEGPLRERLLQLAKRAGFRHSGLQIMDGSRRSRHSNAFFTGLGRFRKIILFDTLVQQLQQEEVEAVLAHEIGHFRRGHIRRLLLFSTASMLFAFWCLHWISSKEWLYSSFGFSSPDLVVAFLLFSLLGGTISFWWSPLANYFSRRFEYQADAFAIASIADRSAMVQALRRLNQENLSNLTPHPWFSFFYYSHPTLLEREKAIIKIT